MCKATTVELSHFVLKVIGELELNYPDLGQPVLMVELYAVADVGIEEKLFSKFQYFQSNSWAQRNVLKTLKLVGYQKS